MAASRSSAGTKAGKARPKGVFPVGDLYDRLMGKVTAATRGRDIRTVTFLWMQGEKDARLGNADIYAESFGRLLDQLRDDLDHEGVNYIIGALERLRQRASRVSRLEQDAGCTGRPRRCEQTCEMGEHG